MRHKKNKKVLLSIAGSDNTSGAGVQCDIKTSLTLNAYCVNCITSVTSQSSNGVKQIVNIPEKVIVSQLNTILNEFNIDCIKIGLFRSYTSVLSIIRILKKFKVKVPIVIDPIYRSTSKTNFLKKEIYLKIHKVFAQLNPIFTPNIDELKILLGISESNDIDENLLIHKFYKKYKSNVILTGVNKNGIYFTDYVLDENLKIKKISSKRVVSNNTHGSGCVFSSSLAIYLAMGKSLFEALKLSKKYTSNAILNSPILGIGYGPVGH